MEGKVAIITGGTGGIGGAVAVEMLHEYAGVVITGRDPSRLEAAASKLGGGARLATIQADPAVEDDMARAVQFTLERFGQIDVLVANAGAEGEVKPLLELDSKSFAEVQMTNITGTFNSIKHAALAMGNSGGAIVATGSVASLIGVPGLAAYTASKHGIAGLVKVAALELAARNIRVNAVAPAPIDNDMMRSIERQVAPAEAQEQAKAGFAALNPMNRYGLNEEVARAIVFLASRDASFINGAILSIDGGFVAA